MNIKKTNLIKKFEWQEILTILPDDKRRILAKQYRRLLPEGVRLVSVNGHKISGETLIYIGDSILLGCDDVEDKDLIGEVKKKFLL